MGRINIDRAKVYITRNESLINSYHIKLRLKNYIQNKELQNAHMEVQRALRSGVLQKPDYCSECGKKIKVYAHHEDYTKPLAVTWLCARCHKILHLHRVYFSS